MLGELHKKALSALERSGMVRAGGCVGVGVSGGADSVALLLLLHDLREELGIRLLVLHFNHQLRGGESDQDEQFVAQLAARLGLAFAADRDDVAAEARRHHWNVEDGARRLRYAFFERIVEAGRATCVAVGHTADDQAETVLARLLRGTGPLGLAGIYPVVGRVVRPLLDVRRAELRAELKSRGQDWREDRTNADPARLRARIRHRLLPMLEQEMQPAIVEHLNALAGLVREEEGFWTALVGSLFRKIVQTGEGSVSIGVADLLDPIELPPLIGERKSRAAEAVSKRLVRRLVAECKGERGQLASHHVNQVLQFARTGTSGHVLHLPGGVIVERAFDRLAFSNAGHAHVEPGGETRDSDNAYEYQVALPERGAATINIPAIGKRLSLKVIDWPPAASDTRVSAEALDRDLLRPPLVLRNWRPGDAYCPVGHGGIRKVKRLFLEHRVAARYRESWPVLTSDGKLAWAKGLPAAKDFAAGSATRAGLIIAEEAQ